MYANIDECHRFVDDDDLCTGHMHRIVGLSELSFGRRRILCRRYRTGNLWLR